jgi:hypothetical protein
MTLAEALSALDGKATLDPDDAIAIRRIVYGGDCAIGQDEADALFRINADAGTVSREWRDLYIEAMADFVVHQQNPAGYVDDAKTAWLLSAISRKNRVREDELEMLIHVLEAADQTPEKLSAFVLGLVETLLMRGFEHDGTLAPANIERLSRVLFASGGDGAYAVTRHEAEALFDMNDALKGAAVDPAWTDLFVRAVGNAVMYEARWAADRDREKRDEAWIADVSTHPYRRIGAQLASGNALAAVADGFRQLGHWDFMNHDLEPVEAGDEAMEARAQAVTADEAHWLVALLRRDGRLDANEKALVEFLRANAASVDPSLQALVQEFGAD